MLISKNFLTREASYKPSYLTSWSQSGPLGTALPELGRQKSKVLGMALQIGFGGQDGQRSGPRAGRRDTHDTLSWSNEKSLKRRLFTLSKSRNGGNGASTAFATKERLCVHVPL